MTQDNRNDLGRILKQQRLMIPLTLSELAAAAGVSASHISRIERRGRFPSARILRRLSEPLGFGENELFVLTGYLPQKPPTKAEGHESYSLLKRVDPYVATVLSQEPVGTQRTVIGILAILKSIAGGNDFNIGFAEYAHRKYPQVDEDLVIMIEDILEHPAKGRAQKDKAAEEATQASPK